MDSDYIWGFLNSGVPGCPGKLDPTIEGPYSD